MKFSKITTFFITLFLFLILKGCAESNSDSIASDEIYASYQVAAGSTNASCEATLAVGGSTGTRINLTSGDSLKCRLADGDPTTLAETSSSGFYTGTGITLTEEALYTVDLVRSDGQCSDGETHSASVVMPAAISITAPTSPSISVSSDLPVTWNDGDATRVEITIDGKKLSDTNEEIDYSIFESTDDDGAFTFTAADLSSFLANKDMVLTVTRIQTGSFPSGLKSGDIVATQVDAHSFTITAVQQIAQKISFLKILAESSLIKVAKESKNINLGPAPCKKAAP